MGKNQIQKEWSAIAKEVGWVGQLHSQTFLFRNAAASRPVQEITDRSFKAYDGFFKAGKGFSKFAKKGCYSSFSFKQGVKLHENTCCVQLPKIGKVKYRKSQTSSGTIKAATICQQADGWYINLACEVDIKPLPINPNTVGLDVGIKSFVVTSQGETVHNPKYLDQYQRKLTVA